MRPKEIIVNDHMQKKYRYILTEPMGRGFHPDFTSDLTPKEMLQMGIFGGKYMTDCQNEFPTTKIRRRDAAFYQESINLPNIT